MTIDINNITLGELKTLQSLFNSQSNQTAEGINFAVGKKNIIRTYSAGVWFGLVTQKSGDEVIVSDARRLNYFKTKKGISLSSIANNGVHEDSRIAEPVKNPTWLKAIELIQCTEEAIISIEGHSCE